ncbi:MAG TPA: serine--tRNA ligase [Sporichthyaceae bacterium]|jgi:seryl-tRNA synthetase|nr:serine--tRNA ligase [Sporichthyaceae bacterium]
MHDVRELTQLGDAAVALLARRGYKFDPAPVAALLAERNRAIRTGDELRAESKRIAAEVGAAARSGGDVTALKATARELKDRIRLVEEEAERLAAELREQLLVIPNLPADAAPDGKSEDDAVEVRRWGTPPSFEFTPLDHVDLGESLGILDFARATKLSGPRFAVARGAGAALERAIATFFLDLHTRRHGYTEFSVPTLVNRATMTGTGQLPKFADDLFATAAGDRELFLIPTAEVPLTNLHADEILDAAALPFAYTAHTPCYRSEAGSYGRDTRGILRLHQFSKVELVRICTAETSAAELELMVSHAQTCLVELGLAHRVVKLAAGDMGFSAQLTYDIEVWLPSQGRYREISSCSDCGQFQARRAGIRVRDAAGSRAPAATLNGSGLPIGRTMAAILENFQQADGSVVVPEALVPYLGTKVLGREDN